MLMRNTSLRRMIALALSLLLLVLPVSAAGLTGKVDAGTLRFRSEPSLSASVIRLLSKGDTVTLADTTAISNDDGRWYKVKHQGKTGYLSAEYLSVDGGVVDATAVVSVDRLNMRTQPSTSSEISTVLTRGTSVKILDEGTNGWYKIQYQEEIGYLKAEFINLGGSDEQDSSGSVSGKYGQITTSRVNFRSDADLSASVKTVLSMGSVLDLTGSDGDWYSASYNGTKGYIFAKYVKVTSSKPTVKKDSDSKNTKNIEDEGKKALSGAKASQKQKDLVETGLSKIGRPYVYGGNGPNSFDCSGFTSWVYRQNGITLNRTAVDQYRLNGKKISKISDLQPGDLVFVRDTRISKNVVSHVGMYIGDGKMVHAGTGKSNGGRCVKIDVISSGYYKGIFVAGKRLVN